MPAEATTYPSSPLETSKRKSSEPAQPAPAAASKAAKPKGKIMLPDEMLIHRKPAQERTGSEYEADAVAIFNEKNQEEYKSEVEKAKARGINVNLIPRPRTYGPADVFSSKLIKDEVNGDRVGIVLTDSKKFYYQL